MESAKILVILGAIYLHDFMDRRDRLVVGSACFITATLSVLLSL